MGPVPYAMLEDKLKVAQIQKILEKLETKKYFLFIFLDGILEILLKNCSSKRIAVFTLPNFLYQ